VQASSISASRLDPHTSDTPYYIPDASLADSFNADVEDLMREFAAAPTEWKTEEVVDVTDPREVQRLLVDARKALLESKGKGMDRLVKGETKSKNEKEGDGEKDESREAQVIIARVLDEVELERKEEESRADGDTGCDADAGGVEDSAEEGNLELPGVPDKDPLPEPPPNQQQQQKVDLDFESNIAARLAALKGTGGPSRPRVDALGLPSAPTSAPGKSGASDFSSREPVLETWCKICQDNAIVQCHGCGEMLYCARCWKEGHMGPDVGWEEKAHEWSRYNKMA
jgi:hypothetical protein